MAEPWTSTRVMGLLGGGFEEEQALNRESDNGGTAGSVTLGDTNVDR